RARGCFVGLRLSHTRAHLVRAVLEGVAFAMRECLDAVRDLAGPVSVVCAGGGARLEAWRQIQADVYGEPVRVAPGADDSARGAALLAGQGVGLCPDVAAAAEPGPVLPEPVLPEPVVPGSVVEPGAARVRYRELYASYRALHPALRETFAALDFSQEGAPDQAQA